MLIDKINLNHLRIFESVYRTRSMTAAADELHLTQSGISQHIKTLEDNLGVKLFDRINQKLIPTAAGQSLFESSSPSLHEIENTLQKVRGPKKGLSGTVTVGMPMEFGHNFLIPLISEFVSQHPDVKFRIKFGYAEEMTSEILSGLIDFAFVDSFAVNKQMAFEKVFSETLELCVSQEWIKKVPKIKSPNRETFESINYVEYQENAPVLRMWFDHHYDFKNLTLNIRARIPSVAGVASFVASGVGAGVLPERKIEKLKSEGHSIIKIIGDNKSPLQNHIHLCFHKERTPTPVVTSSRDYIKSQLLNL